MSATTADPTQDGIAGPPAAASDAPRRPPLDPSLRYDPASLPMRQRLIAFIAMVFGMFMALLDIQIVASSISDIQAGLGASPDEVSWVQTSYLIAEVIMIPLSGYLSRVFSTRWLFTASCILFTISSVLCAFAWSIESMIAFRMIQGFVGGAMIPIVFTASFLYFPGKERAAVGAVIGLVAMLAPTIGPALGGWLTQIASWHWLFLINIVPGIAVAIAVPILVTYDRPNLDLLKKLDIFGAVLLALCLGPLQYVLEEGPRDDWFEDEIIRWMAASTVICGIAFTWRSLKNSDPLVDLRAFGDRNFAIGCFFSLVIGFGLFGSTFLLPLYLGRIQNYNSLQIGEVVAIAGIFQMISAPIAARVARAVELRVMLAIGIAMFGFGLWLATPITSQWQTGELFGTQAWRGLALLFCFIPINTLALGHMPPQRLRMASGLYNLMRNLGGAIGIAVLNTVLIERGDLHYSELSAHINPASPQASATLDQISSLMESRGIPFEEQAALALVKQITDREANVLAFADAFYITAVLFGVALLLLPFMRKAPLDAAGGGEAH